MEISPPESPESPGPAAGLEWSVSHALSDVGFKVTRIGQHDIFETVWVAKIASEKNPSKEAKQLTRVLAHSLKFAGVAVQQVSLTLSLRGRIGVLVFVVCH